SFEIVGKTTRYLVVGLNDENIIITTNNNNGEKCCFHFFD
ncbi:MAG: hypothetical protein ACI90V_013995, partial [Bacillariaceae sp.]